MQSGGCVHVGERVIDVTGLTEGEHIEKAGPIHTLSDKRTKFAIFDGAIPIDATKEFCPYVALHDGNLFVSSGGNVLRIPDGTHNFDLF